MTIVAQMHRTMSSGVTSNPVFGLDLMNITANDFNECRVSEDGNICVIDAIARFRGIDRRQASDCLREIRIAGGGVFPVTFKIQFPGTGQRPVDVAAFSDIIHILSLLPGKRAKKIRKQQANISTRAIAGDRDLEAALPVQRERLTPTARAGLMAGLESSAETTEAVMHEVEKQITTALTHRMEIVSSWTSLLALKKQLHIDQCRILDEMKEDADARDLIFIRDYRRLAMRKRARDLDASDAIDREWKIPRLILQEAENVGFDALSDPADAVPLPPADEEISIPMVAIEMGIIVGERGGLVGKRMLKLWREKYGHDSTVQPPKRQTTFRGKPFKENTYYRCDLEIMRQAIREVCDVDSYR